MLDPNLKVMGGWFGWEKGAPSSRSVAKYEVLAHKKLYENNTNKEVTGQNEISG